MAGEVVRVKLNAGGKEEIVKVSAEHVEEYVAGHPGAVVMDRDWQPATVKRQAAEAKAEEKRG